MLVCVKHFPLNTETLHLRVNNEENLKKTIYRILKKNHGSSPEKMIPLVVLPSRNEV